MNVGTLNIELVANVARLAKDMDEAKRSVGNAMSSIEAAASKAKMALGAIGIGLSVGAFASMIKGAIDAADSINDLSKTTGIAVEKLAGLKLAAKQSGGDLEGIAASINKLSVNMSKDSDRFRRLGITAKEPLEAFKQLSDIFIKIKDPQLRAALGAEALGKSWASAAPLLMEGGKSIGEMVEKGQKLSGMTQEMADSADKFNDQMAEFETSFASFKRSVAADMLPGMNAIIQAMKEGYEESGKLQSILMGFDRLGAVLFSDEYQSAAVQIKNLQEKIADLQDSQNKFASGLRGGVLQKWLIGSDKDIEQTIQGWQAEIWALRESMEKPKKDAQSNADAMKAAAEAKEVEAKAKQFILKEQEEYDSAVKASQKYIDSLNLEIEKVGLDKDQVMMLTAAHEAAKAPREADRMTIMQTALALDIKTKAHEAEIEAQKRSAEMEKLVADSEKKYQDSANGVWEQVRALQEEVRTYGMLSSAITDAAIALEQSKLGNPELTEAETIAIQSQIAALKQLRDVQGQKESLDKMKELHDYLDPSRAQDFGDALRDAFGNAGDGFVKLSKAVNDYTKAQAKNAEYQKFLNDQKKKGKDVDEEQRQLNLKISTDQVRAYGDMFAASQMFFKEGSKGYEAMGAAAKVMHAAELALSVVKGVNAILTQGEGDPYSAFARMAAMAAMVAALGVAVGGGGANVNIAAQRQATQGTGTVLGDSSAKSDSLAKSIEDLRNNSDQSLPISQDMLTSLQNIEAAMTGLAQIVFRTAGITSGNTLGIGDSSISKEPAWLRTGLARNMAHIDDMSNPLGGPMKDINVGVSKLFQNLVSGLFGKTSASVTDSGLSINGLLGNVSQGKGISQYANVHTTTSSFWGAIKNSSDSTVQGAVDQTIADQVGKVFKGISDTLLLASTTFVSDTTGIQQQLQDYLVKIPAISLRGLTGQALQDALNAVFSSFSDTLAKTIIPGMDAFQKVGEGYYQTIIRIVNGVESASAALEKFGITAIDFADIINKQGDVAVEIMRQSIAKAEIAAQHLVHTDAYTTTENVITKQDIVESYTTFSDLFGMVTETFVVGTKDIVTAVETLHPATDTLVTDLTGVGKIIESFSGSASDLAALYQSLLDLRKLMGDTNLNGMDLSASMIQGAGGISQLNSGLSAYLDKYFTPSEKATAQIKDMAASFGLLGLQLPATKDAFRALVGSIDTSTEAGQKLAGSIIALADPYSEMIDAISAGNESIQATIDRFNTFADTISKFRNSLLLGNLSTLTPEQKYAEALAQYQITLASAKSGNASAQNDLTNVANSFLTASQVVNASGAQYQADFAKVLKDTADAAVYAKSQADIAQSSLTTLISINNNIVNLGQQMFAGGSSSFNEATSSVPGFASGGFFSGGLRIVGENGPEIEATGPSRIFNHSQLKDMFGGSSNAAVIAELRAVKAELAALRADQNQQTGAHIAAVYDANGLAAEKVVTGTRQAATDAAWANNTKVAVV